MRWTVLAFAAAAAAGAALEPLALPGGDGGIGFDDLRFSPDLHAVIVPAGRTGRLDLVDPRTREVRAVGGFSAARGGARGHSQGTTSADFGEGLLFASDRTRGTLVAVDPVARSIVAEVKLGGSPDYVRWVAARREVWVTEPDEQAIEIFRVAAGAPPRLERAGSIQVPDGPESLEVDPARGRAYANTWHDATVAIDVERRAVAARWKNGCRGARGLALDAARGVVLVGCSEGRAVALDAEHGGAVLGAVPTGAGVDIVAFAAGLDHLYVPGADAATLTVVGVGPKGALAVLGTVPTAKGAHCVTADDGGRAYVCDPGRGRLLVYQDPYPATR